MTREQRAEIPNRFPEVTWDRCAGDGMNLAVYGWIARDDGRHDFLVLEFEDSIVWFTTSSARYSREFQRRLLGTDEGHMDCERVEHVFGDLVKRKIVLDVAA